MRVSDVQRQRAIDELRRHCAAGRIDVDEYGARIEQALAATDLDQLDKLLDDLPMLRIADPTGTDGRSSRSNGSRGLLSEVAAAAGGDDDPETARLVTNRMAASVVVVLSVVVVITALAVTLLVSWTWAVALIIGWLIGILQGRLGRGRASS